MEDPGALVEVSEGSSSSTPALRARSPTSSSEDEIQVWISYANSEGTQTTILRMMPEETIADVKLRVQARKGWFASQQKLTFGDMELEDAKTIELVARAAGIFEQSATDAESNHVHLSVHLSDILNVRIKTLQGEATLSAQPENTVRELKEAVSLMNGYLPDHQHVFLEGRRLEDTKVLAEVNDLSTSGSPIVHVLVKRTTKVKILPNSGNEFELSISAVETVSSLKRRIEAVEGIPALSHAVVHNGEYLPESASLADYGVDEDSVLVLEPITEYQRRHGARGGGQGIDNLDESLQNCVKMMQQAQAGFDVHMAPCLASAGTGGAYFLLGPRGNKVAVFKPEDEEPNAENNPKGRSSPRFPGAGQASREGLRKGTLPGEGACREFAAYILDHDNLATVPPTAMVCLKQTSNKKYASAVPWSASASEAEGKRGSIQMFVPFESDCEEMGVSKFPKHEVHKIALLDIRLANTDRNGSNVLVRRVDDLDAGAAESDDGGGGGGGLGGRGSWSGSWSESGSDFCLVPIDHGYCLPGSLSDICFDWIYWPQSSMPFDEEMRAYINTLDVEKDLEKLRMHGIHLRMECELVFRVCNILLKLGAAKGLTAHDIGNIMCRQTMQQSILEKMSHHGLKKVSKGRMRGNLGKLQLHELADEGLCESYLREVTLQIRTYLEEVFDT